jgi:hypothetical protein
MKQREILTNKEGGNMKAKANKDNEIKIVHVMKDGTIRKSVAGLMVPAGHDIYRIMKSYKKQ